jgi:hypothetical protein
MICKNVSNHIISSFGSVVITVKLKTKKTSVVYKNMTLTEVICVYEDTIYYHHFGTVRLAQG